MLFNEIYGKYFAAVSKVIKAAQSGKLTEKELYAIVQKEAFGESTLTIPQMLKNESWPLLNKDLSTPLEHEPKRPLTTLEKRWLKALLSDPRIKLFDPPETGLCDVEPLYPADTFVYFDRYSDGDPFSDPKYIANFKTILKAIKEKQKIHIIYIGRDGLLQSHICIPQKMEYSLKDDKFRAEALKNGRRFTVNIGRLISAELCGEYAKDELHCVEAPKVKAVFELYDERNALERAMLHFSHLEKETERIGENKYKVTLLYDRDDETEILIRLLSFGPMVKVISPESLIAQIKNRIEKQEKLRAQK